jgi:hypothetical protein
MTSMTVSFASIPSHFSPAPVAGVAIGTAPDQFHVIVLEAPPADDAGNASASSPRHYNVTVDHPGFANGPPTEDTDEPQYWSPYYHHITITGLAPNTIYYYQPLIAGSKKDLKRYNLRHSTGAYKTKQEAKSVVEETAAHHGGTHADGDEEVMDESEFENDDELSTDNERRRRLAPPPYDGSEHECPEVDKMRYFRTAPRTSESARLAIVGDLGQFPHSQETMSRLYRSPEDFDALLLAGDIAYAGLDGRKWDTFFDFWDDTPLAERIPVRDGW